LDECADGHEEIPSVPPASWFKGVNTPRHSKQSGNVHQIKGHMESEKEEPEMELSQAVVQHFSGNFRIPVVKRREKRKENSADDHVVKMRYDEIRSAELPIERRASQHDSRQTRYQKLEQKCNAPQHRHFELNPAAPHGPNPVEDFDSRRDSHSE